MTDTVARPSAWRRRGFRQLARSWFFTNVADSALYLMVAVWVKDISGSDTAAAMVFVTLGLPALVAPFLGQVADRMSRKRLLSATYFGMIPILLTLLVVSDTSHLWLVYLVTFAYACAGYLTMSAQSGLVRDLLEDDKLASGNGVLTTIDMGLRLLSPLLGTGLYVVAGPQAVVLLTVVCFAIAAVLLLRVEVDETPPAEAPGRGEYWPELVAGFRHLAETPGLRLLTVILAVGFGAAGLVNATIFPAMEQGLRVDPAMLGALVSLQGVGAIVAGITAARLIGRTGEVRTVAIGMGLLAVGILPLVGSSLLAVMAGLVLVGLGVPWVVVAYTTVRQRLTPPLLQGRTAAASNVAINVPQTLATMTAAALIGVIDYRIIVIVTVVAVGILAASAGRSPVDLDAPAGDQKAAQ